MNTQEQKLIERVEAELKPVDLEQRLRDYLDEAGEVEVAGISFSPSRILEELDPTAFRCAVSEMDYESENLEEINGEVYDADEVEAIREELEEEEEKEENPHVCDDFCRGYGCKHGNGR